MSRHVMSDDTELRELLASIGVTESLVVPDELTDADTEQIQSVMTRIRSLPPEEGAPAAPRERPRWRWQVARPARLGIAAALSVLVGVVLVVQPWGAAPALAQTPAMLHFANVRAGEIPAVGDPAAALLEDLAVRAGSLPELADLPVQRIELDAWWASTEPATEDAGPQSALIPVKQVSYVLPTAERRMIEHRGEPLDADGRPVQHELDWLSEPPVMDEIYAIDPPMGVDYPESLPQSSADLVELWAPEDGCATTRGGCLLSEVTTLFELFAVPPDVTARVWQTLATEPSITSLGETVDRHGRTALVLTSASINPREQVLVLIDPESGQYLGSESILIAPDENFGFEPPAVVSFTSLVSAERVAESAVPDDSTATRF